MGYGVSQDYASGFECEIHVHHWQPGGPRIAWIFGSYAGYGLSQVWKEKFTDESPSIQVGSFDRGQCTSHDISHVLAFHGFTTTVRTLSKPQNIPNSLQIYDLRCYK